jgi:hypothetical protein
VALDGGMPVSRHLVPLVVNPIACTRDHLLLRAAHWLLPTQNL